MDAVARTNVVASKVRGPEPPARFRAACIGLTIPAVALASVLLDLPLGLGLDALTAMATRPAGGRPVLGALLVDGSPVTTLPYFIAGSAVLAIPAAQSSGFLLARFGPARVVPALLGLSGLLFLAEWGLLASEPRAASALLYLHSSVLGAVAISAFWSLLNERRSFSMRGPRCPPRKPAAR